MATRPHAVGIIAGIHLFGGMKAAWQASNVHAVRTPTDIFTPPPPSSRGVSVEIESSFPLYSPTHMTPAHSPYLGAGGSSFLEELAAHNDALYAGLPVEDDAISCLARGYGPLGCLYP